MKFVSFARLFGKLSNPLNNRRRKVRRTAPKRRKAYLSLDLLEDRTVPSTLPLPVITGHVPIVSPPITPSSTFSQNLSNPSIAVNPNDPNMAVSVWIEHDRDTTANPPDAFLVRLALSRNAGQSWSPVPVPANFIDPVHSTAGANPNTVFYTVSSDASVAFDRNDNFYVLESEHSADNTAGALVLFRGHVSPSAISFPELLQQQIGGPFEPIDDPSRGKILHEWVGDAVVRPTLVVDTGLATFTDGSVTQNDPSAGNIYVSWATNNLTPSGALPAGVSFNPNTIQIIASHDRGDTFTPAITVNDGLPGSVSPDTAGGPQYSIPGEYFGNERDTAPVLATSQGTAASSTVPGGQVTVAWDDFGTGNVQPPGIPFSRIRVDRITNGAVGAFARVNYVDQTLQRRLTLPITDNGITTDSMGLLPSLTVNAPADFASVTDMEVTLALLHPNLSELEVVLIPPAGSGFQPITLFQAQPPAANVGISGVNLGLFDSMKPFTGSYLPNRAPVAVTNPGFETGDFTGWTPAGSFIVDNTAHTGAYAAQLGGFGLSGSVSQTIATAMGQTYKVTFWTKSGGSTSNSFQLQANGVTIGTSQVGTSAGPYMMQTATFTAGPGTSTDLNFVANGFWHLDDVSVVNITGVVPVNTGGIGTVFDQHASRSILDRSIGATNHFVGHFLPELGSLAQFNGMTRAQISGDWTLRIRDNAADNSPDQYLVFWSLNFTSGLTPNNDHTAATTDVHGALTAPYPLRPAVSPDTGIGPGITIASDNTLGAFSPYQGRLYIAYVDHLTLLPPNQNLPDHTDIKLLTSSDGGVTWFQSPVNDDRATRDGFSDAGRGSTGTALLITGRPHYQPSVAVDQSTGTVVVTWYDGRYDAARSRVARFIGTSIDGGATFGPETFLNTPNAVFDEITRQNVSVEPLPDNDSSGNTDRDTTNGFGEHQALAVFGGRVYAAWAGNENGGTDGRHAGGGDFTQRFGILSAQATIANGPRIIDGTRGPVQPSSFAADGTPIFDHFIVTFDRPIDPTTFDVNDVTIVYRDPNTPGQSPGTFITAGISVTPTDSSDTTFVIRFAPQMGVGTYSYAIGPNIRDRIKTTAGLGHEMDQDQDSNPNGVHQIGDIFAIPRPLNPVGQLRFDSLGHAYFAPPYDQDTPPIIVPGPHVVGSSVPSGDGNNLVLNGTVSSINVTFDRDMDPMSFANNPVVRLIGPVGLIGPQPGAAIPASFTVDQISTRTFRINFRTPDGSQTLSLDLNGTYTLVLNSSIKSARGDSLDTNFNAGVDQLRNTASAGLVPVTFTNSTPVAISGPISTSTINVGSDFVLRSSQQLTVALNISYPIDPDLTATLIAPNGTRIRLFSQVGMTGSQANFINTVLDDNASTPIAAGGPPFTGRFNPQQPLGDLFITSEINSLGMWTLEIANSSSGRSGTINSWTLTLPRAVSISGLGEPVADQAMVKFRIFTMDPANPLSHSTWTSVGPGQGGTGHGRISGIVVDPSDPSGNTVYVAGASGGVWKTTNFLTPAGDGPTYIPLTDFGPTFGINIGGLAVFGRNNDPNQSIIFAVTGEGDTGSPGVGFLRSMDGGATWTLLDSTTNVDSAGNILPINSSGRDHIFPQGSTSFKVLVDPRPTPSGNVIVYGALSGTHGGIWRSVDTGNHWQLMRAGQATDIVFDPNSGHINTISNPTGNLDVIFAAFRGEGVFISPNRGTVWNQLLGGVGDPLIQSSDLTGSPPVPVSAPAGVPTGSKGRIVLAKPELTGRFLSDGTYVDGDRVKDLLYEGWLYALVVAVNSHIDGLYLTKDFGQNWTKVRIPNEPTGDATTTNIIPNNTGTNPDYDVFGDQDPQGNYDVSMGIDPTNPNVVYLGGVGQAGAGRTGFIRVDTTGISDAHAFFLTNDNADGGNLRILTNDPVALRGWPDMPGVGRNPLFQPVMNLIRDPADPFNAAATIYVVNTGRFSNTGVAARWIPFDLGGTDHHRIVTFRDPVTGHTRIIVGDDQGLYSGVDVNGTLTGGALSSGSVSRNGNLQIAQFYYGASQPSSLAVQLSQIHALFWAGVQDGATDYSAADVLTSGNLSWGNDGQGDGTGVATDQTGTGTRYQYFWPCCGGAGTNFFRVDGVGRTFGLLQQSLPGRTPDPQWPFLGGFNFAVNPIDGDQIVISSGAGRVFSTSDQGRTWFVIGDPAALDSSNAPALAFGAPDPRDPSGALNDFVYAGTNNGHIYVTFTGGGANNNQWINLSAGLSDNAGVRAIVTNPTRGSHEAYAVTFSHVYHMVDSSAPGATWQDITGNLRQLTHNLFAPFNDASTLSDTQLRSFEAIQADWRYAIPNDPAELINPISPPGPTHPALYVGGEGGVYRSVDNGQTWTLFPDQITDGARQVGGYLPNAHVTDLDLALGNIDPTTGRPQISSSPDVLLATTYGRGSFAIRVAPIIVANSMYLDSSVVIAPNTTNQLQPIIHGMSELGAFGNTVTIQVLDANGAVIGTGFTDGTGRFTVQIQPGVLLADGSQDGTVTFRIRARDGAGAIGEAVPFSFTLDTHPIINTVMLDPSSDSGRSNMDGITNVTHPVLTGHVTQSGPVTINVFDVTGGGSTPVGTPTTTNANGDFSVQVDLSSHTMANGLTISLSIVAVHRRPATASFSLVLDTVPPTAQPPQLQGDVGNHQTTSTTPTFTGSGEANALVRLNANGTEVDGGQVLVDSTGHYTTSVSATNALTRGSSPQITVQLTDVAGNTSAPSAPPLVITIITPVMLHPPTIFLDPNYNIGVPGQNIANTIPQLYEGTSDPGTTVVIKDGTTVVATFTVDSTGRFSRFLSLANGTHSLTLMANDSIGDSANSVSPLIVTVDTTRLSADQQFVRAIYNQALGRPGTASEWNAWVPLLAQQGGRFAVANYIERSFEARDHVVRGWYQTYLGRTPQNGEEFGFAQAMVNGATEEAMLAGILGSPEYFNHAATIPGVGGTPSNATFVKALYVQLLNRQASQGEIDAWVNLIPSIGRGGVASAFLGSAEYRGIVVINFYSVILRRSSPPSAQEVSGWVNSGIDLLRIEIFFEASAEFYLRVTGVLPVN